MKNRRITLTAFKSHTAFGLAVLFDSSKFMYL